MFPMPEKTKEEDKNKNERNKESNHIPNSPKSKIIMNNTSINDNEKTNFLINNQDLNSINKEIENIASTGQTKISWSKLKSYIIYIYEKNVRNFIDNQKNSSSLDYLHSGELLFPFLNKKENKDEQMDLNISNENNVLEDKHGNLIGDFNLNEDSHLIDEGIKSNEGNNKSDKDENIEKDIVEFINKMNYMPFTIQRIAELLLEPKKYYSTLLKYNRAFYKLVNIDLD